MMAVFLLGFTNRLRFLKEAASGRQLVSLVYSFAFHLCGPCDINE